MDTTRKVKITRTTLALGSYLFHGMNNGVLGPSILDIAALTQSSNLQAASCLTWRSIGTLGGLLSTGFFYDRYNEHLLLGFTMLIMGATVAIAPFCTNLSLMYLFLIINGVMQGSATVGHTGLPVKIWGAEKCGPVVQAIHLMSSLGSALIPLILAPFLIDTKGHIVSPTNILHIDKHSLPSTSSLLGNGSANNAVEEILIKDLLDEKKYPNLHKQFLDFLSKAGKYMTLNSTLTPASTAPMTTASTLAEHISRTFTTTASTTTASTTAASTTAANFISTALGNKAITENITNLTEPLVMSTMYIPRIQYGYAVLAVGLFVVSMFHFLFAIQKGSGGHAKKRQHGVLEAVMHPYVVLFIFFWLGYFNGAIETVYGEVIQPFLDRHLGWSAKRAAFLIAIFWFSQGGGRFVGIPIAKWISPDKMLLGNTLVVIFAGAAIVFYINNSVAVWMCIIIAAVGLSTERGCEVSWLVLLIPFKGINNGILFCGIYAGKGLTPIIYGVLSKHHGQMVLMYMGVIMSITMAIVVIICISMVQFHKTRSKIRVDEDEIEKMISSGEINSNTRCT